MEDQGSTGLRPGTIVSGRYEILAFLGAGGMGQVYRARHRSLRNEVALKVLGRSEADGEMAVRFEREAQAAARLDHPGCVRVLDSGRTLDGHLYMAMELLSGPTLAQVMREVRRVTVATAVRVATQLLGALAHAHRAGVLHRDVKPANVMFAHRDHETRLVLIDFGLARVVGDEALTAAGVCIGSPYYLAPERVLGRPYDGRADLYAVGVVLYEMLTGQRPFSGEDEQQIARGHVSQPVPPLAALRADVPPALEQVMRRALEKKPAARFPDAESMLAALVDLGPMPAEPEPTVVTSATPDEQAATLLMEEITRPSPSLPEPSFFERVRAWLRQPTWPRSEG